MSAAKWGEQVALVAAACDAGWVDPPTAVAVLCDATGLSSGLCLRLFAKEIRARAAARNDDGTWTP